MKKHHHVPKWMMVPPFVEIEEAKSTEPRQYPDSKEKNTAKRARLGEAGHERNVGASASVPSLFDIAVDTSKVSVRPAEDSTKNSQLESSQSAPNRDRNTPKQAISEGAGRERNWAGRQNEGYGDQTSYYGEADKERGGKSGRDQWQEQSQFYDHGRDQDPYGSESRNKYQRDSYGSESRNRNPRDTYALESRNRNQADSYGSESRNRNSRDSYGSESRNRNQEDSYDSESRNKNPRDSYGSESRNRSPRDSYDSESRNRNPRDSYRSESRNRSPRDSYDSEARNRNPRDSYGSESRNRNQRDSYDSESRNRNQMDSYGSESRGKNQADEMREWYQAQMEGSHQGSDNVSLGTTDYGMGYTSFGSTTGGYDTNNYEGSDTRAQESTYKGYNTEGASQASVYQGYGGSSSFGGYQGDAGFQINVYQGYGETGGQMTSGSTYQKGQKDSETQQSGDVVDVIDMDIE